MAESKVIRENYISLQGWMIRDLQLKGNELIIYACIYGFSQAENQVFSGSLQYLADWTNTTKQSVVNCLKSLTEKGYIVKSDKIINGVKFCEYYAKNLNEVYKNFEHPIQNSLMGGIKKDLPNNIDSNNLLNNIKNIIEYLNSKLGSKYSYKSSKTQTCIKSRFNEIDGLTVEDFYTVIDKQYKKWSGTDMAQYLRPETLFGNKFESYLNAPTNAGEKQSASKSYDTDEFFETALRRSYNELTKDKPEPKTAGNDEKVREKAEMLKTMLGNS